MLTGSLQYSLVNSTTAMAILAHFTTVIIMYIDYKCQTFDKQKNSMPFSPNMDQNNILIHVLSNVQLNKLILFTITTELTVGHV